MRKKNVFVTVGTTKFSKLIDLITTKPIIETLLSLGYNFVQVQTGREFGDVKIDSNISHVIEKRQSTTVIELDNKLTIKYDPYFEDFEEQINSADLVISHAGAGTCLEVLHKRKPLVVVINEDLMDNHQLELAEELQNCGYLYYCSCSDLENTLRKDLSKLIKYPEPQKKVFSNYLDERVGFV